MVLHLSNALKGIRFYRMPDIPYDLMFKRLSMINECHIEDKLYRAPLSLIRRALFPELVKFELHKEKGAKILFYQADPSRKSNEINFLKAVKTINSYDFIIERHGKKRFFYEGFIILSVLVPVWIYQLRSRGLNLIEKYQIVKDLIGLYPIQKYFRQIDFYKYSLLVCYHDCVQHECLLNLMFKDKGITTSTLQHGQFNAWRENTYINCGLELSCSPSDYFLCWNKFTQDEAIKCGWIKERTPIVGVISNIGRGRVKCIKSNNGVFGVVLSHPSWHQDNLDMIRAANLLASHENLRYYLKLHPNYEEKDFEDCVDENFCLGNVKKGIDLLEYANMVDFSVVGSSSVFAELVYFYHDIIRYSSQLASDKYRDISIGNVFYTPDGIVESYHNITGKAKDALFKYLCETNNAERRYKEFFKKYDNRIV